ncbi:MAG: hypothetical protein ACO1O4_04855 [Devosia sp.]
MTLFALYRSVDDPTALPVAVSERFSWFAALLPPVHALLHRHWDLLCLFVVGLVALIFGARYLGPDASLWLYILLAIACGFAAPGAERRALKRRGLVSAGHRFAVDADLARLAVMESRP